MYIKQKEVTKSFNFTKTLSPKELPKYVNDYVFKEERILIGYKTSRDYGIFTDNKIILFDNDPNSKQVYVIPYKSVSTVSVVFKKNSGEIMCMLESGSPLRLSFVNMEAEDKLKLRLLYSGVVKLVNGQNIEKTLFDQLADDDFKFDE